MNAAKKRPGWLAAGTLCIAMLLGAPLPGAAQDLPVTDKIPAKMTKIRVMTYNGAYTSLPVQVAKDLGIYAKYNLDAELIVVNSGPAGVAGMLGGSIDFIEPPTDQIMENVVKGTDVKIVVGNEIKNFYKVMVSNKVPLPNASKGYPAIMQDLKGLRIGVNALGATTHLMANALFAGAKIDPASITYVAVGSATTALAAWQAGRIDAQMAFTPFPEIVEALGTGKVAIDMSKGEGPAVLQKLGGAFEAFSAKGAYIRENPEVVNAFIRAHVETLAWIKNPANRPKLIEEIGKFVNTSVIPADKRDQTLALMIDNYAQFFGATVDRDAIAAWNEYLLENKLLSRPVKASEVVYSGAPKP